jgi:hypothetical protein
MTLCLSGVAQASLTEQNSFSCFLLYLMIPSGLRVVFVQIASQVFLE